MKRLIPSLCFVFASQPLLAGEIVRNDTLGFEVELPDGWTKIDSVKFYENLYRVKASDPEFQDALVKNANVPVVMVAKHPEPFDDVNPSLKINVRPYGSIATRDGAEIIRMILPALAKNFADFEETSPPSMVEVGGKSAGHAAVKYTMQTDTGSFPIASEIWIVPAENFLYMVGVGYRQDGATGTREEIISSVESLKFVEP